MNGGWLLLPFLLVRFGLPPLLDQEALRRAAHFAPRQGGERAAYAVYQGANAGIFLGLFFLRIRWSPTWLLWTGVACYLLGLGLCAASLVSFSHPDRDGLNTRGLYRFSRNPIYLAYFLCFVGMAALTQSPALLGLTAVFQCCAHWIILAEERWCAQRFGARYVAYCRRVRRYL